MRMPHQQLGGLQECCEQGQRAASPLQCPVADHIFFPPVAGFRHRRRIAGPIEAASHAETTLTQLVQAATLAAQVGPRPRPRAGATRGPACQRWSCLHAAAPTFFFPPRGDGSMPEGAAPGSAR